MSMLTSYTDYNKVILSGKTRRVTCEPIGDVVTSVQWKTSGDLSGHYVVTGDQWYKTTTVWSARYKYVGMDLDTAQACADAMRSKFTRSKKIWRFDLHEGEQGMYEIGWYDSDSGTICESEISLENTGGRMYEVVINAQTTDESFETNPTSGGTSAPACFDDVD